jgi:coatomer subunit gamma
MAFASKKEDESGLSSYYNNKTTIIQEARVFNESPISPRKCRALLTRIVYLLYVGETFGTQEATTLFFGTTKLFQHKDVSVLDLRQSVFLMKNWCRARFGKWYTWQSRSWPLPQKMSLW